MLQVIKMFMCTDVVWDSVLYYIALIYDLYQVYCAIILLLGIVVSLLCVVLTVLLYICLML